MTFYKHFPFGMQLWEIQKYELHVAKSSKRWLEAMSHGRGLSVWPITCQIHSIFLWWMLWYLEVEAVLSATECFTYPCGSQKNNAMKKGAFEVCGTWLNQFPLETLYLEQDSHTTWIPSMIKEDKQRSIIIKILTNTALTILEQHC